jgi:hypothetical protein
LLLGHGVNSLEIANFRMYLSGRPLTGAKVALLKSAADRDATLS